MILRLSGPSRAPLAFAAALALAAPAPTDPLAAAAQRKFDILESGKAKPGAVYVFSSQELNAWARYKIPTVVPEGVTNPRLELSNGSATAYATVNFLKIRHGQGIESNWLISKLIDGDKQVVVNARIASSGGRATVFLQRVEISGLAISGGTLDFFIDNFFMPLYPDAKIGQPFDLAANLDHIEVRPTEVRAVVKAAAAK